MLETLVLEFKKIEGDVKTKCDTFYLNSKAETIINESDVDDVLESIYSIVTSNIQESLRKRSGWIIDSVIDHNNNISNCNPLVGSSYTKLTKELNHPREGLINIQNIDDNECFKWCLVRYLHPADYNPRRITKPNKNFTKKLDFKDIKFPVKIRDIQVIEKKIYRN